MCLMCDSLNGEEASLAYSEKNPGPFSWVKVQASLQSCC